MLRPFGGTLNTSMWPSCVPEHRHSYKCTFEQKTVKLFDYNLVTSLVASTKLTNAVPVSTWMGDCLQACKQSWYVASHPGQLSLAITSWVNTMSTSWGRDVNRHIVRCTSSVFVVWQCKLVSGWEQKWSVHPYGPYDFMLFTYLFLS